MTDCLYDKCHSFKPNTHNHVYCQQCSCKRKEENRKKLLAKPLQYDEETFQLEENRKIANTERKEARNQWILDNKSFAFFDIETTGLDADGDEILCACIKDADGIKTFISKSVAGGDDSQVVAQIRDELRKYDYIVTWYGTNFDMKFLTTRLLLTGQEKLGYAKHVDLYYTARYGLKLHSNSLQSVAEALFDGKTLKTRLSRPIWKQAQSLNRERRAQAFKYIIEHCQMDVVELEGIFNHLVQFRNLGATPLRKY